VQIEADGLDYNLATRRARLANVRVAAAGEAQPFFTADSVAADASYQVFFGKVAIDEVTVTNGTVRIVRRADGTTNLPKSSGGGTGDPAPLPIARIIAPRLAVEYRDEPANVTIRTAALTADVSSRGRLALDAPLELTIGSTSTRIDSLQSDASFDGRDLKLSGLQFSAPELRGSIDGMLALLREQRSMDLRVVGDSELANAAKWWGGQGDDVPRGSLHLDGTVSGPLSDPVAHLQLTSDRVVWQRLDVTSVAARVRLDARGLQVDESRAGLTGGQVIATGELEWEAQRVRLDASWQDVSASQLVVAISGSTVTPSGRASGEIKATGSITSIDDWNVEGTVRLTGGARGRGLIAAPGEASFRLAGRQWNLDARHRVGDVTYVDVALTGRLTGDTLAESAMTGTLVASESQLQSILEMLKESGLADIQPDLVDGSIRGRAEVEGTIGRPLLHLVVDSDQAVVSGQRFANVQARGHFNGSTFSLEELVAAQPPPDAGRQESGSVRVTGQFDVKRQEYSGTLGVTSWRIDPTSDLPLSGVVGIDYSGNGRGRMVFGKATVVSNLTVSETIALGQIVAEAELEGDHAVIAARAPEFNAIAEANIGFDAPYQTTLKANAQALNLARAVSGIRLPVALDGTADLAVEAEGPLSQWRDGRASLDVTMLDGHVQTLPISLRDAARVRYGDGRVVVERLEASVGKTAVSAAGALPLSTPSTQDALLATLTGDLYDVAVAAAVAADATRNSEAPIAAGKGPLVLLARITGTLESPTYAADLEVGPGMVQARSDLAPVENLRLRAHVENGLVELRDLAGSYHGANVTATGQAPLALFTRDGATPSDGGAVLKATAMGVTSAVLAPFVDESTISQVAGSLDARLDLTSSSLDLNDVQGEVVLDRLNLTVADLPVTQQMPTRIVARDGVARIESWTWESEGTSVDVSGQVHLSDQRAAILANGSLDARLLTPFLGVEGISTAGQVNTRLSVTGALTEPTINGEVRLTNGELRLREPRLVASELNAMAVLARSNAFITSLTGTVNGGALTGSGQVQYAPELRGQFSVNVSGMAMNFPEGLRTEIDSSLELTTAVQDGAQANRLSGLVTIKRGAYREPLALLTGLLTNLQRTGTTTGSPPSPFLESLALDVRVITDEDLIINNNVAKAQLGADLRVINVASSPALSGRAELREGGQLFLGRNTFVIQNGTIDFANPTTIEPVLGIEASTRVARNDIDVRISGTPQMLMTELTSPTDPNLGQADLTSLLLTGRKLDELGEAQAAEVGAQVIGTLGGDVLGIAGRAVGLDTVRVVSETNPRDPADLATETDPTSRVTFGKSVGGNLDVTLSQSLKESNAQTWIVDYLPVRRIALRFVQNDEELRSYEFRHDLTFGNSPQAVRSGDVSREIEQPRVAAIHLMGSLGFPDAQVRGMLRLTEGDRFDFIDWQEDRDRIERFYQRQQHWAARITTNRSQSDAGVELTYTIEAGPETHVRVMGATLSKGALEEIQTAWTESVYEGFLVEEAEGIVRRELAQQATYQPMLEVKVEGDDSVRTLVIDVTPTPRADRVEVRFDGAGEELTSQLRDQAGSRAHALRALTDPGEYQRTVLALLHSLGYPQATVSVGVPMFEETVATVPVAVNSGPQFRVGEVRFEGATGVQVEDLRAEAALEKGALYRAADVESARVRLQTRHRREGFTMAAFEARQNMRADDGIVDVTFAVEEGPRQVIQEIAISGLQSVNEEVARRTLRLKVGDGLRTDDWLDARRRLFESGLFRRADIAVEPQEGVTDTAPVRLRVTVEEWPALRVRYGFQVSEERPEENLNGRDLVPGVSGDVTRRTLFGRAITVGAAAQYQNLERLGRVFMNTPTFFGRPVQSSLALERSREESRTATLVTNRTTAAWEQRGRWQKLTVSYGLRWERNRTFDTKPIDPDFPFDLTAHIGRLTSSGTWDTRDDPSDATRGTFASTSLEHGTSKLGSDLLFIRSLTQAYHFTPWKRVVLASAARYGIVEPLGGQVLVPSLRFFAGGARTVRGVAEDTLGGTDFLGNPIGGRGVLTLNQEMRFPIYRWLRGVVFVDAGNVFPEGAGFRLQDLVGSTGFGARLATPFAIFRVDYGKTIWNRPVQDSGIWVFGIGQTF
jgi:outer membrane protein assembly factor BamA/autotransporter translocation and assembly factor TamB